MRSLVLLRSAESGYAWYRCYLDDLLRAECQDKWLTGVRVAKRAAKASQDTKTAPDRDTAQQGVPVAKELATPPCSNPDLAVTP